MTRSWWQKAAIRCSRKPAIGALRETLLPLATIITPNLPEAGVLLEARPVETIKEMYRVAERLRELMPHSGARWVYLKGGHLPATMHSTC